MSQKDIDYFYCIFCFAEASEHVYFRCLDRQLPFCSGCLDDLRRRKKTAADVKERLAELRTIGVMT